MRQRVEAPLGGHPCGPLSVELSSSEDRVHLGMTCQRCGRQQSTTWAPWERPPRVFGSWEDYYEGYSQMPFELLDGLRQCSEGASVRRGELSWVRDVEAQLGEVTAEAEDHCDGLALRTSRRFGQQVQTSVYWAVRLDPTGRVGQLAQGHPGWMLMLAHVAPVLPRAGEVVRLERDPLWGAVLAGERLRDVAVRIGRHIGMDDADSARLTWAMGKSPAAAAPNAVLALVASSAVPPSDVPADDTRRLSWLDAIARTWIEIDEAQWTAPWAVAAMRWASAHHEELEDVPVFRLHRIMRFLMASGLRVGRNRSLASLIEEQEAFWDGWVDVMDRMGTLDKLAAGLPSQLPQPPYPAFEDGGLRIEPVATGQELLDESRVMHHCVFSYLPWVQNGEVFVYRAWLGELRSTIMLRQGASGWEVEEHAGVNNRQVTAAEGMAVVTWVEGRRMLRDGATQLDE